MRKTLSGGLTTTSAAAAPTAEILSPLDSILSGDKTKTLNGKEVEIDADDPGEGIRISKAKVIKADVAADNGVIHLINRVLLP
jgi:uncharacterized surface protein with fasciclin (FAS1) repeats